MCRPGLRADFIILDHSPLAGAPPSHQQEQQQGQGQEQGPLPQAQVLATFLDGKCVFQQPGDDQAWCDGHHS